MIDFQAPAHLHWRMRNSWKVNLILLVSGLGNGLAGCSDDASEGTSSNLGRPDVIVEAQSIGSPTDTLDNDDGSVLIDGQVHADTSETEDIQVDTEDGGPNDALDSLDVKVVQEATLYPAGRILSPITSSVADNLRAIAFAGVNLQPNVFMKVGASSTISSSNLHCFGGDHIELDDYQDLEPAIDFFLDGDADGANSFERVTLAAKVGMSAGWVMTGFPSPLDSEIEAIDPSYAFVHYGTNDMGLGATYQSALWKFGDRMLELSDELIAQGIIPILMTIAARGDKADANRWVPTYNAVIRAIAQSRQVPLLDLHFALEPLAGYGLAADGIHLNTYKKGGDYRPCIFTPEGLNYGMNMRNLISLMALDAMRWTVALEQDMAEEGVSLKGAGTTSEPFIITKLPFADSRSTGDNQNSSLDVYTGCDADQDESGPEYVYQLSLNEQRSIRALVIDQEDADIDLHLLDSSGLETGCLVRDHQIIEATLAPGTYYFVLDTYVSGGTPLSGDYLFVLIECEEDDPECKALLLEDAP